MGGYEDVCTRAWLMGGMGPQTGMRAMQAAGNSLRAEHSGLWMVGKRLPGAEFFNMEYLHLRRGCYPRLTSQLRVNLGRVCPSISVSARIRIQGL